MVGLASEVKLRFQISPAQCGRCLIIFYFNVISGCDDLLPILSFVIIRSGMAQLISECDAMEEFIPEG